MNIPFSCSLSVGSNVYRLIKQRVLLFFKLTAVHITNRRSYNNYNNILARLLAWQFSPLRVYRRRVASRQRQMRFRWGIQHVLLGQSYENFTLNSSYLFDTSCIIRLCMHTLLRHSQLDYYLLL